MRDRATGNPCARCANASAGSRSCCLLLSEVVLSEPLDALPVDLQVFDALACRIAEAFDLLFLYAENIGDDRVAALIGERNVDRDRLLLPVAEDAANALFHHAWTEIQL